MVNLKKKGRGEDEGTLEIKKRRLGNTEKKRKKPGLIEEP